MTQLKINIALCFVLFMAACAGESGTQSGEQPKQPQSELKDLTTFAMGDETTRTTGEYTTGGVDFYWTENDRIWVNKNTNPLGTPDLVQDVSNNVNTLLEPNPNTSDGVNRAPAAKFYFNGNFTAPKYIVRYTGKNGKKDKVTFSTTQTQPVPNDASHLGESGDCGIAEAKRVGGRYNFTLEHKAAYLTLMPYTTMNFASSVKLTGISIQTFGQAVAGEFNFNDSGIDLASRPTVGGGNNIITLSLNKFTIPTSPSVATNGAIIVFAPGTYNRFDIIYTLYDETTHKSGVIRKKYTNITWKAGENRKVATDLKVPEYQPQPSGTWLNRPANVVNCVQAYYYIRDGRPYGDVQSAYTIRSNASTPAHIYTGGVWIRKASTISGFNATNYHGITLPIYPPLDFGKTLQVIPGGAMQLSPEFNRYYFMPATGDTNLRYWMKDPHGEYGGKNTSYCFAIDFVIPGTSTIGIGSNYETVVMPYWIVQ